MKKDALLDIKEVADYLQMNKMTVYKLAREGKIPAFKVASEWRFRRDLIDSWLMSQVTGTRQQSSIRTHVSVADAVVQQGASDGLTILVVDDEPLIRELFTKMLSDYRVIVAGSGEEALDIIGQERPDVVLLDLKMPGIDGLETLKRIKEIDESISVVMLSAFATLEVNLQAVRLGAYTSMAKPFDQSEIRETIRAAAFQNELSSSSAK